MTSMLSLCYPYMSCMLLTWSLPGPWLTGLYLVTTWSLLGLYLVPIWSLIWSFCGPGMVCRTLRVSYVVPIRPAWYQNGPYTVLVPTWSIPGPYLVHLRSICGTFVLSTWTLRCPFWSCMVLTRFLCVPYVLLHVPYVLLHGLYGPYKVPTQSWSAWSQHGPYLLPKGF